MGFAGPQAGSSVLLFASCHLGTSHELRCHCIELQKRPHPALSAIFNITIETLMPLSDSSQIFKINFAPDVAQNCKFVTNSAQKIKTKVMPVCL